ARSSCRVFLRRSLLQDRHLCADAKSPFGGSRRLAQQVLWIYLQDMEHMSKQPSLVEITFRDLPHHLVLELHKFSITMIGIDRVAQQVAHQGSGTLVHFRGKHYILTAAHCAESLRRFRELGLTIGGRQSSETHSIPEPTYVGEQRH